MKKHYYIIFGVILFIAAVAVGFYVNMGGFAKSTSIVTNSGKQYMVAQHYKGKLKDKAFATSFATAADLIQKGPYKKGVLAAYYLNDPDKNDGVVDAYVGVLLVDSIGGTLPTNFESFTIPARKVIQTKIKAHFSVASKIYTDVKTYAKAQKLKVKSVEVLEVYPSEKEFELETPLLK